ncbi:synaptonemal complex protein 1 isoform X2 [Hemibagrus wyckioides]|uniref:synaptonemal complex protein 1 isoform X2 n=1 Tax=Hemibagrus wyckioides TaxID=337641 RepID=UPI00266D859D|nr:synaptonemal complex protein 1 isoform X2 [Hemibagrus wyckioides]
MEKAFNFKLLVPPRHKLGPVSAVKPQDTGLNEENRSFTAPVKSLNKCFEKDTISNSKMVLPKEYPRPDKEITKMSAVMPVEKEGPPLRSSQLYSKLYEEAEKIKAWKLKMDYDMSEKDRNLQENRRTIETQRKAIQELQFENESLSMKLEEQLNKNEDMRNKHNATRNLCNILKDTFERSVEKMSLFEADREETHGLCLQNHETIQRMVAAFESLRLQAEADQLEMFKAKEGLKQFEELKVRFENEYHMKEEKVSLLEEQLREMESQHREILLKLHATQENFSQLQSSANQHLLSCKQEQNELKEKLEREEKLRLESEEKQKSLVNTFEQTKEMYEKNLLERDIQLKEIKNSKEQLALQIKEIQVAADSLQSSLESKKQRVQELESELTSISQELCNRNKELGIIKEVKAECDSHIQGLKFEMETKENALKSFDEKIKEDEVKIHQMTSELEGKEAEINKLKEKFETAALENKTMVATLEEAVNEQTLLKEQFLLREVKLQATEGQLSEALKKENELTNNIGRLQTDISQYKDRYENLLERFNQLLLQKNTVQEESDPKAEEMKETLEKMKIEVGKLEVEKQQLQKQLEEINTKLEEQHQENENIQELLKESNKSSQNRLTKKERQVKVLELKISNLKTKLETKAKTKDETLKEIAQLKEESQKLKHYHQEEYKKICSELEKKSSSEAELTLEVQKWKQASLEATKSKEDIEIKFQQKIADMVALMERHKHEYDKMVEEKDSELNEKRMQEAEVNANKTSLELELSYLQVENVQLKQQLDEIKMETEQLQQQVEEITKMQTSQKNIYQKKEECLQIEMIALKKQIESLEKDKAQLSETASNTNGSETPDVGPIKKSTPAFSTKTGIETPLRKYPATPFGLDDSLKTPSWTLGPKTGTASRIKSFRIRTPPSTKKSAPWKKNTLELDPKSDSSEQNDSISTVINNQTKGSGTECLGSFKKVQSYAVSKSPGAALKLAAMKRMRDAGWTTITSSDKKKKKVTEKIFA